MAARMNLKGLILKEERKIQIKLRLETKARCGYEDSCSINREDDRYRETSSIGGHFLLVKQFKAKYIRCRNVMEVRDEIFRLEYTDYEREFIDLWTTWIRLRVKRSMNVLR